ncbi:hypothetical protein BDW42DRAFT_173071 [Aspergillus taichungensis]|uniref:LYR motif-containing protein Cup1-like N-terminal domain-containing protein n=1 Tax=Aspergillus taichungensis TaxID=482145 RepID=A0A2J5HPW9_9EURO|nr:hypothetical protein BDW42DRAFT_173071 [Aspergillus taichungensis]
MDRFQSGGVHPTEWTRLYRCLLRECSYLPDPVARSYMHSYVVQRFRRYCQPTVKDDLKDDWNRQSRLLRTGKQKLSILTRANEGYIKPFEKVLGLAYGREGPQRHAWLNKMIESDVPANNEEVEELMRQPSQFEDGWNPPKIVIELLRSQQGNATLQQLRHKQAKQAAPVMRKNAWGKDPCLRRRRNIRRTWYTKVKAGLLPPMPDTERATLVGLLSGEIPWNAPARRKKARSTEQAKATEEEAVLNKTLLLYGPKKGNTFGRSAKGRPHTFTLRFMRRSWRRILAMTPEIEWNNPVNRRSIRWEPLREASSMFETLEGDDTIFKIVGDRNTTKVINAEQ